MSKANNTSQGVDRRVQVKLIVAVVLVVLTVIVVLQNTAPVETRILFITVEMPRAALLALTLLIGMLVGTLLTLVTIRRRHERKGD